MKKYFKALISFLFLFLSKEVFCQNPFVYSSQTDSLEKVLKKMPPSIDRIKTLVLLSRNYFNKPSKITESLTEIKALSLKLKYPQGLADHAYLSGIVTYVQKDYPKTLVLWNNSYQQFEALKDTLAMIRLSLKLGELHSTWMLNYDDKNNTKHVFYLNRAYLLAKSKKDVFSMITALSRIAHIYQDQNKLDSSVYYYKESIKIATSINEINPVVGDSYGNLGVVYLNQNKLPQSLINLVKADSIYSLYENTAESLFTNRYSQAKVLSLQGKLEEANATLLKSLNSNKANRHFFTKENYYTLLAEIAEKKNDFKQSIIYLKQASIAKDSAFNDQDIAKFQEWETRYGAEKKEAENQILNQEKLLIEEKNKRYVFLIRLGLIALLVTSILSYFLWRSNLKRGRGRQKLQNLLNFRKKLMLIIAHDIRSPLVAFKGGTQLLNELISRRDFDKIERVSNALEESNINLERLLENLMKWALQENEPNLKETKAFSFKIFLEEVIEMYQPCIKKKNLKTELYCLDLITVDFNKNMLAAVIRNLLFNAIKFSKADTTILISVKSIDAKSLELSIQDTGQGIESGLLNSIKNLLSKSCNQEEYIVNIGLGLQIVSEFSRKLKFKVSVESQQNIGTTFTILMPKN